MAEGARLESVYTGNRIQGSNPCLSARFSTIYKPPRTSVSVHRRLDVSVPHQVLLDAQRRSNPVHPSPVGVPERVSADLTYASTLSGRYDVIPLDCIQ